MGKVTGAGDSDVIVIGAGPTGMTAASLLAARGVRVTVLEMRETTSDEPKAISIDDEALRTYQQAGIADDILGIIVPGTGTRYYDAENQPLFQARAAVPYRLGFPFKNPFAQPELERVLARTLERHPLVDLRFGHRVTAVDQDDEYAYVTAEGPGGPEQFTAQYVLGSDGGRSIVRELFGNDMTGRSYKDVWLVADTLEDPHTERYGMHHGDPTRPHVIVPGLGGRCRYEFLLFDGESEPGTPPPFELIRKLVAPYREIQPQHVERAINYRFNAVNADRWREGRFFLLGDAAHMMPPFAGQGLNSGIRDAANLAWKVAEVVAGQAPDAILDSYESERKPHAAATIAQSVLLGSVVMTTNRRVADYRDTAIRKALDSEEGRSFFEEMRYRPIARYTQGLTTTADAGRAIGQPRVFDTAAHAAVGLDSLTGNGWSLFGVDLNPEAWAGVEELAERFGATCWHVPYGDTQPRNTGTARVVVDLDGGLYREFESYRGRFILLRPDHFTAAVWDPADTPRIADATAAWRTTQST
ncbi:bifunctional 3-(3-hydroxy-phenyl)propionate/3-hydroxycinnamic acid hydroxylase [Arthrobacter sp. zg-ZUI100]|uniref:bifunctional 3-(3-hydroxy-phenyl)propionate/3-hydroxycinnamic acid hydroxylase n=1 Tax=Arthrobacter jiangjiafuii TaxID=2817475 RepID=UPI001AED7C18|nr:bifunctional 3-(3-hydroxy-phenyl)propionate/3-hydroxycinnamic acid hydroxylase [Arthrobacter jiangjiafuii]MBP3035220.1 bifunctional 3-(3-hydroxy-phenyl)propionate/3-hydroxycinnamic acid hydroxylase [Arthrobacter jiangjiafuii]